MVITKTEHLNLVTQIQKEKAFKVHCIFSKISNHRNLNVFNVHLFIIFGFPINWHSTKNIKN